MHITFSPIAVEKLAPELTEGKLLRLLYDTEGCGCVMSGVPALQILPSPKDGDAVATGDPFAIWYQPNFEVFFEDHLTIDYSEKNASFVLKSNSQTYTNHLRVLHA